MIKSFKHSGLELFFFTGKKSGIQPEQAKEIRNRLSFLHAAVELSDMDKPGFKLHELKGDKKGLHSVVISGNWRIVFKFENGHAYVVNYQDYH